MDVVGYCQDLLRIDTSNPGSTEQRAAAYVVDALSRAGLRSTVIEPAPGRCSVVSRLAGRNQALPPLVIHGHLDVVPPQATGWKHDPFGGEKADGCLWGRGAIDMKDFVAMMLAIQVQMATAGLKPRRTLIFAYLADEEMGGALGARWLSENRPEVFEGAQDAVGELGGFRVTLPNGQRLYPLQTAERGLLWFQVTIPGRAGHSALTNGPNPVVRAASFIERVARLQTSDPAPAAFELLVERVGQMLGQPAASADAVLKPLGSFGEMALRARSTSYVPTAIAAGGKANIIPDRADVTVDCRFVPGGADSAERAIRGILDDDMECEIVASLPGLVSPAEGPFVKACEAVIRRHDPDAVVVPFALAAGTDSQHLSQLGIRGYGFCPLPLPATFDYPSLFHAPNERIPMDALARGKAMLQDIISAY